MESNIWHGRRPAVTLSLVLGMAFFIGTLGWAQTKTVAVESLIHDLKNPDVKRRREAARALGEHRVRQAVPALAELVSDPDEEVRREIATAFNKIRDPQAVPPLVTLSADQSREVRRRSLAAMVNLYIVRETGLIPGAKKVVDFLNPFSADNEDLRIEPYMRVDAAVIKALIERLPDPDAGVREDAAKGLGVLRAQKAVSEMQSTLAVERDPAIKTALIRSFRKIGDLSAGSDLVRFISDPEKKVHDEAILTLGVLRVQEAVPELTRIYESGVEERRKIFKVVPASGLDDLQLKCLQSLALIADQRSQDNFLKALRHPGAGFRQAGAEGLARLSPATTGQATEVSRARLGEKDHRVRLAESLALYRMGRKEFLDDVISSLASRSLDDQAQGYLMEFSKPELKELYPHLGSSKGRVRERLCEVFGFIGDEEALDKLQPLTRDRDTGVVAAANQAIRRLNARRE